MKAKFHSDRIVQLVSLLSDRLLQIADACPG